MYQPPAAYSEPFSINEFPPPPPRGYPTCATSRDQAARVEPYCDRGIAEIIDKVDSEFTRFNDDHTKAAVFIQKFFRASVKKRWSNTKPIPFSHFQNYSGNASIILTENFPQAHENISYTKPMRFKEFGSSRLFEQALQNSQKKHDDPKMHDKKFTPKYVWRKKKVV